MEKIAPNLKAIDRFESVVERLKTVDEEVEQTRAKGSEISARFLQIKQQRDQLFMNAFKKISESIDKIYKDLTRSPEHPLGGTASLSLESSEVNFLGKLRIP